MAQQPTAAGYSVLFLCMGNICRSPTAHGVFRHRVQAAGLADRVRVDSAGTHNYHPGSRRTTAPSAMPHGAATTCRT